MNRSGFLPWQLHCRGIIITQIVYSVLQWRDERAFCALGIGLVEIQTEWDSRVYW